MLLSKTRFDPVFAGWQDISSNNRVMFIWSIVDLLRSDFKAHQHGDIVLPFAVLSRLDTVLAPTKYAVFAAAVEQATTHAIPVKASPLRNEAGHDYSFWNKSRFDLNSALGDWEDLAANLLDYVTEFSEKVKDIFGLLRGFRTADSIVFLGCRGRLPGARPASLAHQLRRTLGALAGHVGVDTRIPVSAVVCNEGLTHPPGQ